MSRRRRCIVAMSGMSGMSGVGGGGGGSTDFRWDFSQQKNIFYLTMMI